MKYVLDADVLIGALDGSDSHHARSRELFLAWQQQGETTLISIVNLSEVLIAPAADQARLRAARRAIAALGVVVHSPTEATGVEAARLRAHHTISLPDGYLLATARQVGGTAVSFDRKVARAAAAEAIPM